MSEKRFVGGWWMWILLLVVVTVVVGGVLRSLGMIGGTILERKVYENSFQYSESRKSELAMWNAELANIQSLLSSPDISKEQRNTLMARQRFLKMQIANANRQHNNIIQN